MVYLEPEKVINKAVSHHVTVQTALSKGAAEMAARASADLATHHHDGHAEIEVEAGKVDRYVILSDMRGLKAALSIEYGRKPSERDQGMEGLFILHKATGLERKGDG